MLLLASSPRAGCRPRRPVRQSPHATHRTGCCRGYCYHALNRGNGRTRVFHDEEDIHYLIRLIRQANAHAPMRVIGYCLMPNHFHLVLWPPGDDDLADCMQWLLTSHVHHYRQRYGGSGHVWQGRFKAFPICKDDHLLTVMRYIERNPLRANLVSRPEDWPWSSLVPWREPSLLPWLDAGPVTRPPGWLEYVHRPQTEAEPAALRYCVHRNAPFGPPVWMERTAAGRGLESSLRPQGRPPRRQRDGTHNTLFAEKEP